MVKHTQTIRRQFAHELFECVWPFYGIGAQTFNSSSKKRFFFSNLEHNCNINILKLF